MARGNEENTLVKSYDAREAPANLGNAFFAIQCASKAKLDDDVAADAVVDATVGVAIVCAAIVVGATVGVAADAVVDATVGVAIVGAAIGGATVGVAIVVVATAGVATVVDEFAAAAARVALPRSASWRQRSLRIS